MRERVIGLHVGQLVIVVVVAVSATALLLVPRREAAGDKQMHGLAAWRLQERLDSLYGDGYLAGRIRRLTSPREPSRDDPLEAALSADEQHDLQSIHLVSLYLKEAAKRDAAAVRLALLSAAIVAVFVLSLWVLWVWFGGRDKPAERDTKREGSA